MCYFCRNIYSNFIHEKVATRHIFALEEKAPSSKEISMSIQLGGVTIWYLYVYYILLPLPLPLLNTHYTTALEEKAPSSKEFSMSIQLRGVTMWYVYTIYYYYYHQ